MNNYDDNLKINMDENDTGLIFKNSIRVTRGVIKKFNETPVKEEEFLQLMQKQRNFADNQLIVNYLQNNMTNLFNLVKKYDEKHKYTLTVLALNLDYCYEKQNQILFHYGDAGVVFYLLIKGIVSIIVPKLLEIELNKEEYLDYITLLYYYGEKELVYDLIKRNMETFPIYLEDLQDNYTKKLKSFSNIHISSSSYVERFSITNSSRWDKKRLFIYIFFISKQLRDGDYFGDIALDNPDAKRTATIISETDCHLCTIKRDKYIECMKNTNKKIQKENISFVLSTSLFNNMNNNTKNFFKNNFSSLFSYKRVERGEYLYKENDHPTNAFFIKNGIYEINFNKSIIEINEIIKELGDIESSTVSKYELGFESRDFYNYLNKKKFTKIAFINDSDVVGLPEITYNNKFIFNILSINGGEVYNMELKNLSHILFDNHVRSNYENFIKLKKSHIICKLQSIRDTRIEYYYEFNNQKKPKEIKNLPESIITTYLAPISNIKKRTEIQTRKSINFTDGPVEICYMRGDIQTKYMNKKIKLNNQISNQKIDRDYIIKPHKLDDFISNVKSSNRLSRRNHSMDSRYLVDENQYKTIDLLKEKILKPIKIVI